VNADAISPINGQKATYEVAFDGKRFTLDQWPKSFPPMFTTG
jgi:hypothetical protein